MSERSARERKEKVKELIRQLHAGAKTEDVKERFKDVLEGTGSAEIMQVEEELIREGMPREEVRRLCDVHLAVFRESLGEEGAVAPPGHPVHTLMEEHKRILQFAGLLNEAAQEITTAGSIAAAPTAMEKLNHLVEHFKGSNKHYLREENVLFPYLEKHGVVEPPAIMWSEHDEIRGREKKLYELFDESPGLEFSRFAGSLTEEAQGLADLLTGHFYKENNILFPMALQVITPDEWPEIRRQCDEIGYCCFTPETANAAGTMDGAPPVKAAGGPGEVELETGTLSRDQLEAILNTLPVDLTFVDASDTVRYFSQSPERIFPRTKAIIGRKVQQCHPEKSLHEVQTILDRLKSRQMDSASFWLKLEGRLVLIRYFPVRDSGGEYLGCLEVSQDITDIKKIEGEKRLL
ncbi:MAG TPA: DUF438 domain-containing protein [Spirochaetia bacterium]|nr:DUF438 domain-containing protein [Spirochaetia bacterium]